MAQTTKMANDRPVAIVCVGMAGSGKTTFMQRINSYLHSQKAPPYVINLDPAVRQVPFDSNIDIRDSIDYKEVMKEYNLGPNGGILTSLNIFATKIDQILNILEKRTGSQNESVAPTPPTSELASAPAPASKKGSHTSPTPVAAPASASTSTPTSSPSPIHHIIVDTPGQIEVFVWSASGSILLDSLASSFPTVVAYIIDTPRTSSTSTFMSNMLYACSILYKTKLPMVLVFNKIDVQDAAFAKEWMTDFEAFQAALRKEENEASGSASMGSGYMNSLLNSMSLVLEEFYCHLSVVGVSSMTGQGISEFFSAVKEKAEEFQAEYQPELDRRRQEILEQKQAKQDGQIGQMLQDMNMTDSVRNPDGPAIPSQRGYADTLSDLEDDMDSEPEARMTERDEDEHVDQADASDEDDHLESIPRSHNKNINDAGMDGLAARYRQALTTDEA